MESQAIRLSDEVHGQRDLRPGIADVDAEPHAVLLQTNRTHSHIAACRSWEGRLLECPKGLRYTAAHEVSPPCPTWIAFAPKLVSGCSPTRRNRCSRCRARRKTSVRGARRSSFPPTSRSG